MLELRETPRPTMGLAVIPLINPASFWRHVDPETERDPDACWLWRGSVNPVGYAQIQYWSGQFRRKFTCHATRLSYYLEYGVVPTAISHTCGQRTCVNPRHLIPATERQRRRLWRSTQCRGERHPNAVITREIAAEIRREAALAGVTQRSLGEKYNLSQQSVSRILTFKTWVDA